MTPTGDSAGPPRNDADRADRDWLHATVEQARGDRVLHSSLALWQPGDRFRAWCGVCGWLDAGSRDKPTEQAKAAEHERLGT